jgi:hypothetical protein
VVFYFFKHKDVNVNLFLMFKRRKVPFNVNYGTLMHTYSHNTYTNVSDN